MRRSVEISGSLGTGSGNVGGGGGRSARQFNNISTQSGKTYESNYRGGQHSNMIFFYFKKGNFPFVESNIDSIFIVGLVL